MNIIKLIGLSQLLSLYRSEAVVHPTKIYWEFSKILSKIILKNTDRMKSQRKGDFPPCLPVSVSLSTFFLSPLPLPLLSPWHLSSRAGTPLFFCPWISKLWDFWFLDSETYTWDPQGFQAFRLQLRVTPLPSMVLRLWDLEWATLL